MPHVIGHIVIGRPVEGVFDFVADGRNEPKYNPELLRSELITDGPIGIGSRFAAVHTGRRRPVEMVVELTEYERPRRLGYTTRLPRFGVRGLLTFEPIGSSTRMRWDWDLRPEGFARLATPLMKAIGTRQERACWQGLKRYLEAGDASVGARVESPTPTME